MGYMYTVSVCLRFYETNIKNGLINIRLDYVLDVFGFIDVFAVVQIGIGIDGAVAR